MFTSIYVCESWWAGKAGYILLDRISRYRMKAYLNMAGTFGINNADGTYHAGRQQAFSYPTAASY